MARSKAHLFEDYENFDVQIAWIAKSIGHPMRIRILKHLLVHKHAFAGELVDLGPLNRSTTSHHIKQLRERYLILPDERGPWIRYRINREFLPALKWMIELTFKSESDHFDGIKSRRSRSDGSEEV